MSKIINTLIVVSFAGVLGACSKPEPAPIYIDPEPISVEPVYTGKYK